MSSARKMKLRIPQPKPRNPLVVPSARRKAGTHRKSGASERRAQEMDLKQQLKAL